MGVEFKNATPATSMRLNFCLRVFSERAAGHGIAVVSGASGSSPAKRDKVRRDRLRQAGYREQQVEWIFRHARDGRANLQLLPCGENIGKN